MKIKILMIDDHPMTLKGYELSLIDYSENEEFEICKAHNSAEALALLQSNARNPFQIVFLDIRLPISSKLNLVGGEELGLKIRKNYNVKIIVISSVSYPDRVHGILQNLQPDGFITKVETTAEVLLEAVKLCLDGQKYYCKNVEKINYNKCRTDDYLDKFDLKILHLISLGEKMKNLPKYVPLSLPSIERRKRKIKMYLGVSSTSDRELLMIAKSRGFI